MLSLLLALTGDALAAEGNGRAGLAWPGASSAPGLGEAALGTGLAVGGGGASWSSSADLVLHPGERWGFEAQALFGPNHLVAVGSARYTVLRREHVGLAPWVGGFVLGPAPNTGWDAAPVLGLALDLRWSRWGVDLSAPLVGVLLLREGSGPLLMPLVPMGEVGASFHPTETTSVRLGLASYLVTVRWRHELGERWFYELEAAALTEGMGQARVGLRF